MLLGAITGLLGGALSHAAWMIKIARAHTEHGRALSTARRNVNVRIQAMLLSALVGLGGGFIVGIICYDHNAPIWQVVTLAFLAGFANDFAFKYIVKFKIV